MLAFEMKQVPPGPFLVKTSGAEKRTKKEQKGFSFLIFLATY